MSQCIAFVGTRRVASGDLSRVVSATKDFMDANRDDSTVLIFDDTSSGLIEVDFRGSRAQVLARLDDSARLRPAGDSGPATPDESPSSDDSDSPYRDGPARARGRPRLGVIAREVTLLPRHWDWLATQPGGASAAVRRLVDEARQTRAAADRRREAQEAAYRFMSAMAGNESGFEEATRALFAGDERRFGEFSAEWPQDVRDHARTLAARAHAQ